MKQFHVPEPSTLIWNHTRKRPITTNDSSFDRTEIIYLLNQHFKTFEQLEKYIVDEKYEAIVIHNGIQFHEDGFLVMRCRRILKSDAIVQRQEVAFMQETEDSSKKDRYPINVRINPSIETELKNRLTEYLYSVENVVDLIEQSNKIRRAARVGNNYYQLLNGMLCHVDHCTVDVS